MPISNILQPIAIPPASTSNNGLMTAADKQTLTGLVTDTETDSGATITLTLANNTIYELTATVFAMPASGWYCVGSEDCNNGVFTPAADMRYNLAICQESGRIAVYVMRAL